jgi:hypothetical protein
MEKKRNPNIYDRSFEKKSGLTFFTIDNISHLSATEGGVSRGNIGILVFRNSGISFIVYGSGYEKSSFTAAADQLEKDWGMGLDERMKTNEESAFIPIEEVVQPTIQTTNYYTESITLKQKDAGKGYTLKIQMKNGAFEFSGRGIHASEKEIKNYFDRQVVFRKDDYIKLGFDLIPPAPKTLIKHLVDSSSPGDLDKNMLTQTAQDEFYMDKFHHFLFMLDKNDRNTAIKNILEHFPKEFKSIVSHIALDLQKKGNKVLLYCFIPFILGVIMVIATDKSGGWVNDVGYALAILSLIFIMINLLVMKSNRKIFKSLSEK